MISSGLLSLLGLGGFIIKFLPYVLIAGVVIFGACVAFFGKRAMDVLYAIVAFFTKTWLGMGLIVFAVLYFFASGFYDLGVNVTRTECNTAALQARIDKLEFEASEKDRKAKQAQDQADAQQGRADGYEKQLGELADDLDREKKKKRPGAAVCDRGLTDDDLRRLRKFPG